MSSIQQLPLPFPPEEIWKDIPGYEGQYEVSNMGQVRNKKRGNIVKGGLTKRGYLHVGLRLDGKSKYLYVHRLVMLAFVGASELEVNHKNGKPSDNRLGNLEYMTHRQNIQHSFDVLGRKSNLIQRRGKSGKMGKPTYSILQAWEVKEMRHFYKEGCSLKELAEMYDVTVWTIHAIIYGRNWKHVE